MKQILALAKSKDQTKKESIVVGFGLVKKPFHRSGGGKTEDWNSIVNGHMAAGFGISNGKFTSMRFYFGNELLLKEMFVERVVDLAPEDSASVTYQADFKTLDQLVIQTFYSNSEKDTLKFCHYVCRYNLLNSNTKRLEAYILYQKFGKEFTFDML